MSRARPPRALSIAVVGSVLVLASCQDRSSRSPESWSAPLPDLNTTEEHRKAHLHRYLESTFRFHRAGGSADVALGENGIATAFDPDDAAICARTLANCR